MEVKNQHNAQKDLSEINPQKIKSIQDHNPKYVCNDKIPKVFPNKLDIYPHFCQLEHNPQFFQDFKNENPSVDKPFLRV